MTFNYPFKKIFGKQKSGAKKAEKAFQEDLTGFLNEAQENMHPSDPRLELSPEILAMLKEKEARGSLTESEKKALNIYNINLRRQGGSDTIILVDSDGNAKVVENSVMMVGPDGTTQKIFPNDDP